MRRPVVLLYEGVMTGKYMIMLKYVITLLIMRKGW